MDHSRFNTSAIAHRARSQRKQNANYCDDHKAAKYHTAENDVLAFPYAQQQDGNEEVGALKFVDGTILLVGKTEPRKRECDDT